MQPHWVSVQGLIGPMCIRLERETGITTDDGKVNDEWKNTMCVYRYVRYAEANIVRVRCGEPGQAYTSSYSRLFLGTL